MENIINIIIDDWNQFIGFLPRIFIAVLSLVIFYYIGKYFAGFVTSLIRRASIRDAHEAFFKTLIISIALFFGIIVALNILGLENLAVSLLAGGGVTAIVLGFAFREIGENFLAGIFLAFSRPFKTGDAIKTEDIEGKVQDIALRYTHLRTEDGRDIYVPSSQLFSKPVTNFTRDGLRRISFTVGIDYANDSKKACTILKDTIADVPGVLNDPEPGAFIQGLLPQYVEISAFFWVDVFNRVPTTLTVRTDVMDKCRSVLLSEGFTVSSGTVSNIAIVKGDPV